jgi:hypothetical protein
LDTIPAQYTDLDILNTVIPFGTSVYRALAIQGAICLALKHPQLDGHLDGHLRGTLLDILTSLEQAMEAYGLPPPKGGWRQDVPIEKD